jgi:OPA family glycerol-3-phosphate transporter-like MFS transporter
VLYAGLLVGFGAAVAPPRRRAHRVGLHLHVAVRHRRARHALRHGEADFGGRKNAGIATGIIDGFVYLGTAVQSAVFGGIGADNARLFNGLLPAKEAAKDAANWKIWPIAMLPLTVVGLLLATRVWNAKPKAAGPAPAPATDPATTTK